MSSILLAAARTDGLFTIRNVAADESPVIVAKLPAGRKDPGDCTHKEVWNVVMKAMMRRTKSRTS
jgi:hypothetical protein